MLVLVAVACIPWMLFAKPFLIMKEQKAKHEQLMNQPTENGDIEAPGQPAVGPPKHDDHEDITEIFIHQVGTQ